MLRQEIKEKYPFINVLIYGSKEYVGMIVNQDQHVTTILNYELLKNIEDKKRLLALGEVWWMESNRTIPITIFLKSDMKTLKYAIMTMNTRDVQVVLGPVVNLSQLHNKKLKRKSVHLVRQPKKT